MTVIYLLVSLLAGVAVFLLISFIGDDWIDRS